MTDEEIISETWHWVVDDKLGYGFAISIMIQDGLITEKESKVISG